MAIFELISYRRPARQQSPYVLKRVRYLWSRLFGTRLQKSNNLHFVTINGQRFKRLIVGDSALACGIERNLESFRASGYFPPVVIRFECEIWVEFIHGTQIQTVDEPVVKKIADFYATVYAQRSRQVDTAASPFVYRLHQDLRFLNQVGILSSNVYQDVTTTAERLAPKQVWVGFDYTDPVLKNFVTARDDGRLYAVDVESLVDDQLIGMGVAKACRRWLEPWQHVFFTHLAREGVPDFQSYFPFVEMCFLARWTKRNFFEKKWKSVEPTFFERFRHL
jgi:hypothetical protein